MKIKKPIKVSAPEYVNYLVDWIQVMLDNEKMFPSRVDIPFPKQFQSVVKQIFKRLFRVFAHIYHSHFKTIVALGAELHLNTCVRHFILFVTEHKLVDKKELAPLSDLIDGLLGPTK